MRFWVGNLQQQINSYTCMQRNNTLLVIKELIYQVNRNSGTLFQLASQKNAVRAATLHHDNIKNLNLIKELMWHQIRYGYQVQDRHHFIQNEYQKFLHQKVLMQKKMVEQEKQIYILGQQKSCLQLENTSLQVKIQALFKMDKQCSIIQHYSKQQEESWLQDSSFVKMTYNSFEAESEPELSSKQGFSTKAALNHSQQFTDGCAPKIAQIRRKMTTEALKNNFQQ